ncbi:MAG: hypothetical protein QM487_03770 [Candidatus Marithrix sp.]
MEDKRLLIMFLINYLFWLIAPINPENISYNILAIDEVSFISITGRLIIPKVTIDKNISYNVVMQQEQDDKLLFSVTEVIPIPTFKERHKGILYGQTKQEIAQLLGFPAIIRQLEKQEDFSPTPNNLYLGDTYEHWQYLLKGRVYIVWFAATPDNPADIWTVIGTTTFLDASIF